MNFVELCQMWGGVEVGEAVLAWLCWSPWCGWEPTVFCWYPQVLSYPSSFSSEPLTCAFVWGKPLCCSSWSPAWGFVMNPIAHFSVLWTLPGQAVVFKLCCVTETWGCIQRSTSRPDLIHAITGEEKTLISSQSLPEMFVSRAASIRHEQPLFPAAALPRPAAWPDCLADGKLFFDGWLGITELNLPFKSS